MRWRSELGAGGAAPCRKVEALGVEPDRPPAPGTRSPGGSLVPRESSELGKAKRIRLREEPLFRLDQRRFALAGREDFSDRERGGAAKAAVEMHVLDAELEEARNRQSRHRGRLWDCAVNTGP